MARSNADDSGLLSDSVYILVYRPIIFLKNIYDKNSMLSLCDLGCGNGDLLYLIKKNFKNL